MRSSISLLVLFSSSLIFAQTDTGELSILPAPQPPETTGTLRTPGFQWKKALLESFGATAIAHTVRATTEDDTESELGGPFFRNYFHSLENFHGFDDGDAFYTTWVLHPMEGSLFGYIEQQNDPAYRDVEFGMSQRYWVSRMRALAFSAAMSTQWTAGPISEASIGNVQHYGPPGLNDIIITPTLGVAWMAGEDAADRYLIRWIEARTDNPVILLLARSTLNPTRAYANIMRFKVPWWRDDRGGIFHHHYDGGAEQLKIASQGPRFDSTVWPKKAAFELEVDPVYEHFFGAKGGACIGGEGRSAIKVSANWSVIADVGGCELIGLGTPGMSGDTLWYLTGSRYVHKLGSDSRLQSYVEGLAGGMKIVHDYVDEQKKAQLTAAAQKNHQPPPPTPDYTTEHDTNALSIKMGMGLTWSLNAAAMIRLCAIDYQHSWDRRLDGFDYQNGLQVSAGMSFRLGYWGER